MVVPTATVIAHSCLSELLPNCCQPTSYISPEQRVPHDHPLRPLRVMTDEALRELQPRFNQLYAKTGRPSTLDNVIEVALRRIPITPDLNPNLVVRHRTSLRPVRAVLSAASRSIPPMRLFGFGPSTNSRHRRVVCAQDR
jgi:hypothetical protein